MNESTDELSRSVSTADALAAVRRAVRSELLRQAKLGNSVPVWQNDQVVWITPDEIFARDARYYGTEKQAVK